jgi:thymidylate synthase (FAD)
MSEKNTMLLNKKIKVLDTGHVELCDYMGDDEAIVRCARQSYKKDKEELSNDVIDRQIKQMLISGHSSPFEQVVFKFHLRVPIFVARQIVRHRTARMNELSGRYTEFSEDSFHIPDEDAFINRLSAKEIISSEFNYQENITEPTSLLSNTIKSVNDFSFNSYKKLIDADIPRELAREVLPLNLYTEFYWQMDLHNILHFLELRLDEHAQVEIREFAYAIYYFVEKICPITIKYFNEYQLNKMTIGKRDIEILVKIFSKHIMDLIKDDEAIAKIDNIIHKNYTILAREVCITKKLKKIDEQFTNQ